MRRVFRTLLPLWIFLLMCFSCAAAQAAVINHLYVWDASHGVPADPASLPPQAIEWSLLAM